MNHTQKEIEDLCTFLRSVESRIEDLKAKDPITKRQKQELQKLLQVGASH